MSAGLPGLGLGGLFFIFSALLAPFIELWRTLRGRSGIAAWRGIGRQFAQAVVMIVGIDLSIRLVYLGLSAVGLGEAQPAEARTVLPLTLIGITSALLVAVMGIAKLADLAVRARNAERRLRALPIGAIVALVWFALPAAIASEPGPLEKPRVQPTTEWRLSASDDAARLGTLVFMRGERVVK